VRRLGATALVGIVLALADPLGAAPLPEPTHDPEEVEELADEILDRSEFRQPEPNPLERARQWVEREVGELFESAFSGSAGSLVGWAVLAAGLAAALWFGTRFGRTVQSGRGVAVTVEHGHQRTPGEWRSEAADHEAAGRWKQALRCRYRALVGDLVAAGVLDDVAGRTSGEFRREVADRAPGAAADFGGATELFELAWYGDRPTGPDENRRFRDLADRVGAGT
jgi:hypothetical protein